MIHAWLTRRRLRKRLIEEDAAALIEAYGDMARTIAWRRSRAAREGVILDGPQRPPGHWDRVSLRIAYLDGSAGRVDTATRYGL